MVLDEVNGRFDLEKTRQALGALFRALNRTSLERMQLLKLLYIADRETIRETGFPITCDTPVAMAWGPVLSATYDCIKGTNLRAAEWRRYFVTANSKDVRIVGDPGIDQLSDLEIRKPEQVARDFGHLTGPQLSKLTHEFQEWKKNEPPKGSSRPISHRDRLEAVGLGDYAEDILALTEECARADRLLAWAATQ